MKSRLHSRIGSLRQLEILLAVYETGSITEASNTLFLTQPTISMQLKKLADSIDMRLYDVIGKRIVFTEAGHAVAASAKEIFGHFEHLDMNLTNMRGLTSGTLKLAVVTTSKYFIPHLLGPFCKLYPAVDVQMNVGNRQQMIDRLNAGNDDFYVFSHPPKDIETEKIEFLANPLVAIAHEDHPLKKKKQLTWDDIANEPFLMREEGSGTRLAIEEFVRKNNYQLNVRMTIESNEAIKHAVMSGLGISILSGHTLVYGGEAGLTRLKVPSLPIKTHWYFVWLKAKQPSLVAQAFLKHVEHDGRAMLQEEFRRNGFTQQDL